MVKRSQQQQQQIKKTELNQVIKEGRGQIGAHSGTFKSVENNLMTCWKQIKSCEQRQETLQKQKLSKKNSI